MDSQTNLTHLDDIPKIRASLVGMSNEEWAAEQTRRIGDEIKRLRGKRTGQWLSDRTAELGQRVSRSTISEIETGRRKSITVTDLILLAAALNTTPVALVYPGPYTRPIKFTPNQEVPEIWAAQWFSGLHRSISHLPFSEGYELLQVSDPQEYSENMRPLREGRRVWQLSEDKAALWRDLQNQTYKQRHKHPDAPSDEEIRAMRDTLADYQRQIDELAVDDLMGAIRRQLPDEADDGR